MIYVDLDNTLINSAKQLELEIGVATKFGISADDYWKAVDIAFAKYGISGFSYQALFEGCRAVKPDFSGNSLPEWQKILETEYLFPDTIIFLRNLGKNGLTLLTTGNPDFQWAKIRTHELAQYFGKILIVDSPKAENIDRPPNRSFFIDDSPREIDAMKQRFPHVLCLQVRQPAPWEKSRHVQRVEDPRFREAKSGQKISGCKDAHFRDLLGAYAFIRENE